MRVVSCVVYQWSISILKSVGFLGLISLLEFTGVKNSFAGIAAVSPLTIFAVSTYSEAIAVRGLSACWWHIQWCSLCNLGWRGELHISGCFLLCQCHFAGRGPRLQRSILKQSGQGRCRLYCCAQLRGQNRRFLRKKPRVELAFLVDSIIFFI